MNTNHITETSLHDQVARQIADKIQNQIQNKNGVYIITVAGESGCGKTETGASLFRELKNRGIESLVINQDNYFVLPPALNDARRKSDPAWLGPHAEVKLDLLQKNINDALSGKNVINIPVIDYHANTVTELRISLEGIKVIIIEGTYVSLLRKIDARIFITSDYNDTLPYRKKRNRGNEVNDSFVENILITEHKIIAGHRHLADYLISNDLRVTENI
jgi:uridine kinase